MKARQLAGGGKCHLVIGYHTLAMGTHLLGLVGVPSTVTDPRECLIHFMPTGLEQVAASSPGAAKAAKVGGDGLTLSSGVNFSYRKLVAPDPGSAIIR